MRLVHDDEVVLGEVVEEAGRPFAGQPSGEVPRVILDAGAGAHLEQHLDVKAGARLEPLCLEQLAGRLELEQPLGQFGPDCLHGALDGGPLGDEVLGRIDGALVEHRDGVAGERIDAADTLHGVAPQLDAIRLLHVGRVDLDRVAADTEGALLERGVVPAVLDAHQVGEDRVAPAILPGLHRDHQASVLHRVTEAVDRAHRRHDHDVVPLHQARGGAKPQRLDVLVDRRVLLDVYVGGRDIRFGLVVVVVRDEVLDGIGRQELPELAVQLRRKRLVVGEDERRLAVVGDSMCASVSVLPDPVTPSSVWYLSPRTRPAVSSTMALGWSPAGSNGATT